MTNSTAFLALSEPTIKQIVITGGEKMPTLTSLAKWTRQGRLGRDCIYVPPMRTNDCPAHTGFGNAILLSQGSKRFSSISGCILCSSLYDYFISKFGRSHSFSPCLTAFTYSVIPVVLCSALKNMTRVEAGWIVAGMTPLWLRPMVMDYLETEPMCRNENLLSRRITRQR